MTTKSQLMAWLYRHNDNDNPNGFVISRLNTIDYIDFLVRHDKVELTIWIQGLYRTVKGFYMTHSEFNLFVGHMARNHYNSFYWLNEDNNFDSELVRQWLTGRTQ